ncbi:MAG: HAMP domain-containing histidine kinase [Planctomycetes bacterium]|nr:HAMP domain-containing histidine kinase [Planctomycetota bacterium]
MDDRAALEREKLAALAEFAAGAGHELNNPLAVIAGRAQLLLRGETDPERRRDLATICAQAQRVHEMIVDLMLFARPPQLQFAQVDLVALVKELTIQRMAEAAEREIEFRVSLPPEATIRADASQLSVALGAMLDNSLRAVDRRGTIEILVAAAAEGDALVVSIGDTGPGIPPEARRHLFDPFYSGRSAGRGLGFGLSKAWRLITLHGGSIAVDEQSSGGARLVVTVPRHHG